jgi:hypothetical protein
MSEELVRQQESVSLEQLVVTMANSADMTTQKVEVLERLMAMMERRDEQRRKEIFDEALRLCQSEMPRVAKNGLIDPKGAKIPYARLEDLDACIRPIYQKHGFTVTFDAPNSPDGAKIRNVARFSCAGHTEALEITASPSNRNTGRLSMTNAQAVKQTITECRRHLQEMFFNIITEGADEQKNEPITQGQADDIRTRMNDLPQSAPGVLLQKLCRKYGIERPEELGTDQYEAACRDVELTERQKAK